MTDENQNPKKLPSGKRRIIIALIWAGAMLLAAFLLRGSDHKDDMFFLILAIGASSYLFTNTGTSNCERRLWNRLFHKAGK